MGAIVVLKSFLGIIFLSGSFLLFFILSDFFGYKFESVYLRDATYLALFGILIGSFANIFKTTYQAKLSARRAVIPMFVQLLVQNLLIILFSFLYVFNRNVIPEIVGVLFIYAYVLGQFARLLIYSLWAIRDKLSFKRPSKSLLKDYILFSIPLALSGIVATIQAYTDRAMLLFFWNYNEVGGYFTVQKLALFITYFGASVSFFLYPTQSHYYEKDKREDFQRITVKSERYLSLISVPFVFFTFVMSTEILNIFIENIVYSEIDIRVSEIATKRQIQQIDIVAF
jgi:O-antigen/teichoic acid export membrane protein